MATATLQDKLSHAQELFAEYENATPGLSAPSGAVFMYRRAGSTTYRWLVTVSGEVIETQTFSVSDRSHPFAGPSRRRSSIADLRRHGTPGSRA